MRAALCISLNLSLVALLAACEPGSFQSGGDDDVPEADAAPPPPPGPDAAPLPPPDDGRVKPGLAALYKFKGGSGGVVRDVSEVPPALDLTIGNATQVSWSATGLGMNGGTIVQSAGPATKIFDACTLANEITVEAWITPSSLALPNASERIVTMSADTLNRNFMLGQIAGYYELRLRTENTDLNGSPAVATLNGAAKLQTQHVVYTRNALGEAIFTVDGIAELPEIVPGSMATWDPTYPLAIGNEITLDRPWHGEVHLVAIYCRALLPEEIAQNLAAGY